jgi:hypothetical protein
VAAVCFGSVIIFSANSNMWTVPYPNTDEILLITVLIFHHGNKC